MRCLTAVFNIQTNVCATLIELANSIKEIFACCLFVLKMHMQYFVFGTCLLMYSLLYLPGNKQNAFKY